MNAEDRRRDTADREEEAAEEEVMVDRELDEAKRIAPSMKQITAQGILASLLIGIIYNVIVMKLALTMGLIPNPNVSKALLAFVFVQSWTKLLERAGIVSSPFSRQENTVIPACAVACYSIAEGGGFGSYLLALNRQTYLLAGVDTPGNSPEGIKEPGIGWMASFLFVSSFVGLLALVSLRKMLCTPASSCCQLQEEKVWPQQSVEAEEGDQVECDPCELPQLGILIDIV